MSLREASAQSNALIESLRTTFQQIGKLSKEADTELAQDIHESLKQHEDSLELLQQDVQDLTSAASRHGRRESERSRESARLAAQVARLGEDLRHARSQFRRAQLTAKRSQEAARRTERETQFEQLKKAYSEAPNGTKADLFAGRRTTNKQQTEDELIVSTNSDITAALRHTHDQLNTELSRSRFAQQTLAESTAALSDLGERYSNLDTLLANSRTLLGTLVKSQKSDTWYLETAFYILIATLVWLVFRRIIYGPAWWFIWLPLRTFIFWPFAYLLNALGGSSEGVAGLQKSASVSSRTPLRVQPSATGGIPTFPAGRRPQGVPAGGGGAGAKSGPDGRPVIKQDPGLAEKIGRMVEESRQQAEGREGQPEVRQGEGQAEEEEKVRADGTKLEPRGDKPANPKKKMFEADVEDAKHEEEERRKRDEL